MLRNKHVLYNWSYSPQLQLPFANAADVWVLGKLVKDSLFGRFSLTISFKNCVSATVVVIALAPCKASCLSENKASSPTTRNGIVEFEIVVAYRFVSQNEYLQPDTINKTITKNVQKPLLNFIIRYAYILFLITQVLL